MPFGIYVLRRLIRFRNNIYVVTSVLFTQLNFFITSEFYKYVPIKSLISLFLGFILLNFGRRARICLHIAEAFYHYLCELFCHEFFAYLFPGCKSINNSEIIKVRITIKASCALKWKSYLQRHPQQA